MFTELNIKNFKCFKDLEVKKLGLVNTVTGFNQSGKSSFLEAIFCLGGFPNHKLLYSDIFRFRNLVLTNRDEIAFLFYQCNPENSPIYIKGQFKDKLCNDIALEIKPYIEEKICGLNIVSSFGKEQKKSSEVRFFESLNKQTNCFQTTKTDIKKEDFEQLIDTFYKGARLVFEEQIRYIIELSKNGKKGELIDFLNELFQENITDLFQNEGSIEAYKPAINKSIPTQLLGDGFNKVISLFSPFFMGQKVILIDEIENCLHHTLYKKVIYFIFRYAQERNVQVFIATHNKEFLKKINEVLEENEKFRESFKHHLLVRDNDKNNIYTHSYKEFHGSLKTTFDLRDE